MGFEDLFRFMNNKQDDRHMKKLLVYLNENDLAPRGGPLGYNYNLKMGLDTLKTNKLDIHYLKGISVGNSVGQAINGLSQGVFKKALIVGKSILNKGRVLYGPSSNSAVDLSAYDAVHFHQTFDMYRIRKELNAYKGKVILTSHTPTKPSIEIYDRLSSFEKKYFKKFYNKLSVIDDYAFNRADSLIFPCEEAEEPYFHTWEKFKTIKEKKIKNFFYCPTGTVELIPRINGKEIRAKYNIPQDSFLIAYVGRHNEIKGYDKLKEIGRKILSEFPNVYFIIAGKEEPLKGLTDKRWIEIGWTKDPGSILNSADICLLPNKETYFDLVLLEILSLGKIVLATETGGNRYFNKYTESGILLYNTTDEAISKIKMVMDLNQKDRYSIGMYNRKIYENDFNIDAFARNYVSTVSQILNI